MRKLKPSKLKYPFNFAKLRPMNRVQQQLQELQLQPLEFKIQNLKRDMVSYRMWIRSKLLPEL